MHDRSRLSPLRALTTVVASLTVLAGVPAFLAMAVGWPLPSSMPSSEELVQAFERQDVPVEVIMKVLAVVAWVAWSQLAWGTLVEAVAFARGRAAAGRGVIPAAQQAGRQFVTAVAFLAGTLGSIRPVPAATPSLPVVAATAGPVVDGAAAASSPPAGVRQAAAPSAGEQVHDVVHGDTFWGLAERYLGSGARWREIRDRNVGRAVAPGRVLGSTEDAIDVGWRLAVPAIAPSGGSHARSSVPAAAPDAAERAGEAASSEILVQGGDDLWRLAEHRLSAELGRPATHEEVRPYWAEVVEANRGRLVNRLDPDRIYPGQRMKLPPVPHPSGNVGADGTGANDRQPPDAPPTEPPDPAPPRDEPIRPDMGPSTSGAAGEQQTPAETADPSGRERERAPVGQPDSDDPEVSIPMPAGAVLAGTGTTLLAAGAVRAIRRRRRRRDHLVPDTMPVPSGDPDLHRRLVASADEDLTDALGRVLDDLAERVAAAGHACRPLVVQHSHDHVDVLLDRATTPAVEGWQAQAGGEVWTRDPSAARAPAVAGDSTMAAPLLVTLGQPDDGGQLYLDLEAARVVSLTGDLDVARSVAATMIAELAHTPLASNARVAVVGDALGVHRIDRLDRVEAAHIWSDGVAADLASWNSGTRETLTANGWPNAFIARANDPDHDALIPLAVIASGPPEDADLLAAVADGPASTAAVVIGDPLPGAIVIDCQRDHLSVPQIGLTCRPIALETEEVGRVADLIESVDDIGGEQLVIWPDVEASKPSEAPEPAEARDVPDEEYHDPPYEVLVRFLGDIVVETADGTKTALTDKQTALVAYLALHREVGVDRVADALWATPAAGSPRKRLANLVNRCRGAIGGRYLPDSDGRTYRIGPGVATDVDLFDQRVQAAGAMPPERAVDVLRGALELVRGTVFTRPGGSSDSYAWIDAEIWVSTWELKVAAVTQRSAEMCLDLDDPAGAVEIAEPILRGVVPTHPGLTETLMRAHAAGGNRHAVRSVYQAHVNALEQLDLDTVAPSTSKLYERLRGE